MSSFFFQTTVGEGLQIVVDVGHVVTVAERFLVGPFGFVFAARRAENVGQVSVGCGVNRRVRIRQMAPQIKINNITSQKIFPEMT